MMYQHTWSFEMLVRARKRSTNTNTHILTVSSGWHLNFIVRIYPSSAPRSRQHKFSHFPKRHMQNTRCHTKMPKFWFIKWHFISDDITDDDYGSRVTHTRSIRRVMHLCFAGNFRVHLVCAGEFYLWQVRLSGRERERESVRACERWMGKTSKG